MLRKQFSEPQATYGDPKYGVNLLDTVENLVDGEARLMQNCERYGSLRIRRGSQRITPSSLGPYRILGGHKYYRNIAAGESLRLVAYNSQISAISNTGAETVIGTGLTPDLDTYFKTWSITDSVYISNGTNVLMKYDGTAFSTVSGTNIPIPRSSVVPVLDRLLCITANGIERTNARVDNVWSNNSSWATLRPQQPGLFTALHPFTLRGTDTLYPGAIAFQERAYYLVTGTSFGNDVTVLSPDAEENVSLQLLDGTVGTFSPDAVCTVPGVGIFWYTTDNNVFWLPEGSLVGRYIGDLIQSTSGVQGIESTYTGALKQVWMAYHDYRLMIGVPIGTNSYATTQFWLDIRELKRDPNRPVWYGPMIGQSVNRVWVENEQGDNQVIGGEGNADVGAFIYQLRVPARFTDAVGLTDNPVQEVYKPYFKAFGSPAHDKFIQSTHILASRTSTPPTLDLEDINSLLGENLPLELLPIDNPVIITLYGSGALYGDGTLYASDTGNLYEYVVEYEAHGHYISVTLRYSGGEFIVSNVWLIARPDRKKP